MVEEIHIITGPSGEVLFALRGTRSAVLRFVLLLTCIVLAFSTSDHGSVEEKGSWMSRTFHWLVRPVGKPSALIGFLLILASIFMGWNYVALAIVTILIAKAKFFPVKESRQRKQTSGLTYDSDDEFFQETNVYRRYDDTVSKDFEMDPKMITNDKKIEWKGDGTSVTGAEILKAFKKGKEPKKDSEATTKFDRKHAPDVDTQKFLQDPRAVNLCFLPTDTFIRICSMVPVSTFLNLSSACRFLRWRMFAFCTCFIRNPVIVKLKMSKIIEKKKYAVMPSKIYKRQFLYGKQPAGLFAYIPPCLGKPFFCETLVIEMVFYTYNEDDYARALPIVLPLRPFTRRLFVHQDATEERRDNGLDYPATNRFYKALNATSFRYWGRCGLSGVEILNKCPFTREMDMAWVDGPVRLVGVLPLNRIGYYCNAEAEEMKKVIDAFLHRKKNLEFHVYSRLRDVYRDSILRFSTSHLLEYLFTQYDDWEEYFSDHDNTHLWYTTIHENGRRLKLRVCKNNSESEVGFMIGKDDLFDKMEQNYNSFYHKTQQYIRQYGERKPGEVWKMETEE